MIKPNMKLRQTKTLTAIYVLAFLNSTIAQTQAETGRTDDALRVIKACDRALKSKDSALHLSDLAIQSCKTDMVQLQTDNDVLRESDTKFYRNPFVMFFLGAGAAAAGYLVWKH